VRSIPCAGGESGIRPAGRIRNGDARRWLRRLVRRSISAWDHGSRRDSTAETPRHAENTRLGIAALFVLLCPQNCRADEESRRAEFLEVLFGDGDCLEPDATRTVLVTSNSTQAILSRRLIGLSRPHAIGQRPLAFIQPHHETREESAFSASTGPQARHGSLQSTIDRFARGICSPRRLFRE
jgi:hypothetical protein